MSSGASSIRLTPSGRLHPAVHDGGADFPDDILDAFARSEAEGLFELAARRDLAPLSPELAYWREFSSRFLALRCKSPVGQVALEALAPLDDESAFALVLEAPPLEGAEYLDAEVLRRLWVELDEWLRAEAGAAGGLEAFLAARAPSWRQVGRVCFHLAENKKDPDYPFAFLATYAPRIDDGGKPRYQPLSRALFEFAGESDREALRRLLTPVSKAAESSALVRELLEGGDIYQPLAWTPDEAYRFLREIPLFEESGVLVRVPDWWAKRPRPRVSVSVGSRAVASLGADAVLDFDIGVALGGESLDAGEVERLLQAGSGLTLLKGRWVEIDAEQLGEALAQWKKVEKRVRKEGISFAEGMRLLAGAPSSLSPEAEDGVRDWSTVTAGPWLAEILGALRAPESLEAARPGSELKARLRPYQEQGLAWLRLLAGLGLGACLADDMGLGKTIQVIALLVVLKKERGSRSGKSGRGSSRPADRAGPSLLVLPASLLANWKSEMERFAPSLRVAFVHPSMEGTGTSPSRGAKNTASAAGHAGADGGAGGDGSAKPPFALEDLDLVATTYGMLQRTPWIGGVEWDLVILDEAQAIKNPGARQTKAVKLLRARSRIALTGTPVENRLADLWSLFDFLCPGLLGSASAFGKFVKVMEKREDERYAPLRRLVRPYILRRLKTDRSVIDDLPDKTEVPAYCGLSKAQAVLYRSITDELERSLGAARGMARRGLILSTLMRLKQVCNHPSQLSGDGEWEPDESGKFARLAELCEEIASRQDRVLVFTQFREATEPVAAFLAGVFGREGLVLHGGTPVKERQKLVAAFQDDDGPPFFVLSLKAGGTGLNLTAASHVIHFDRWWNPAVESQATDRAFRIGQKKNVMVHKFICRGTVEERIDRLLGDKRSLAENLLEGGGEALLTEMSDAELVATVGLDLERAREGL